ncbi:hypothetical protein ABK040_012109 [Willaertia magna]
MSICSSVDLSQVEEDLLTDISKLVGIQQLPLDTVAIATKLETENDQVKAVIHGVVQASKEMREMEQIEFLKGGATLSIDEDHLVLVENLPQQVSETGAKRIGKLVKREHKLKASVRDRLKMNSQTLLLFIKENKELKDQCNELKKSNDELKKSYDELKNTQNETTKEINRLKKQLAESDTKVQTLTNYRDYMNNVLSNVAELQDSVNQFQ